MSSKQDHRRGVPDEPWNFIRRGTFGVFTSSGSLPIEYLQTTFRRHELSHIKLARDVAPDDDIDFELLMQRDIDTVEAIGKLKQYLDPKHDSKDTRKFRDDPIFFPPLLIACIPCKANRVLPMYPNETWSEEPTQLFRTWENLCRLEFFTNEVRHEYELCCPHEDKKVVVDIADVVARFSLSFEIEHGMKLIAIDGQHRLYAMRHIPDEDLLNDFVVPVCILFATYTSEACNAFRSSSELKRLPNVPQTFRKVFVDVNSKMNPVGTHFSILLNDTNIGSLIVREFCREFTKIGKTHLSTIEWNVRKPKDATILTRSYSITSIGILEKALRECFAKSQSLLPRVLNIENEFIKEKLEETAIDSENPHVQWSDYSIAQRSILEEQVRDGIVRILVRVFTEVGPFEKTLNQVNATLLEWEQKGNSHDDQAPAYALAHKHVTNHSVNEIPKQSFARELISNLDRSVKTFKNRLCPVMAHALYQRSIVLSLKELLWALPSVSVRDIPDAFVCVLEQSLNVTMSLFDCNSYTQHTIWINEDRIVNLEKTRAQFSRLTLAICGRQEIATAMSELLSTTYTDSNSISERLKELGRTKANEYWNQFKLDSVKVFKRRFRNQLGLNKEEIDKLEECKNVQESEKRGKPFDDLVNRYLEEDFDVARQELVDKLGFDIHATVDEFEEESEDDD